jgi:hypothetical protein
VADEPIAMLVALSRKRLEMIAEDPDVVFELVEARDEDMRGVLNLGQKWRALADVAGAALTGEGGQHLEVDLGVDGVAKIFSGAQVRELSQTIPGDQALDRVRALYAEAAAEGHGMLVLLMS